MIMRDFLRALNIFNSVVFQASQLYERANLLIDSFLSLLNIKFEMKILIIALLVFSCVNCFKLSQTPVLISSENMFGSNLQACTSAQISLMNSSISACQTSDIFNTVDCIDAYYGRATSEQWNYFAKNSTANPDAIVFWYFNQCYVNVTNYGRYSRVYIFWPDQAYTIGQKLIDEGKLSSNSLSGLEQTCPQFRINAVKTALLYCDIAGNSVAAQCIASRIKDQINQFWNVYVGTTKNSAYSIWYYNSCIIKYDSYGTYLRNIYVGKAYPY